MEKIFNNGNIIRLSDNSDFLVVSSVIYSNCNFLYLVDINDNKIQYIGEAIKDNFGAKIEYVDGKAPENQNLVKNLIKLFYRDVEKFIEEKEVL